MTRWLPRIVGHSLQDGVVRHAMLRENLHRLSRASRRRCPTGCARLKRIRPSGAALLRTRAPEPCLLPGSDIVPNLRKPSAGAPLCFSTSLASCVGDTPSFSSSGGTTPSPCASSAQRTCSGSNLLLSRARSHFLRSLQRFLGLYSQFVKSRHFAIFSLSQSNKQVLATTQPPNSCCDLELLPDAHGGPSVSAWQ